MKITVDTDDLSVDGVGEALRQYVFDMRDGKFGCYSTFDVNEGFVEIDPKKYPDLYDFSAPDPEDLGYIPVYAYENEFVVAMWWWDGDGDLTFWIKGEPFAYNNSDCKHDYGWLTFDLKKFESNKELLNEWVDF